MSNGFGIVDSVQLFQYMHHSVNNIPAVKHGGGGIDDFIKWGTKHRTTLEENLFLSVFETRSEADHPT